MASTASKSTSKVTFSPLAGEEVSLLEGEGRTLGTFKGVFVPTILNLLGLMMYLRQGWVVGNAGLVGALSIVIFCCLITGITALSISSIITNIRIGSGGVFSLVSQSLGLQVGGSIGIPLYLVQALSSVLYMFGFIEAWAFVFPDHPRAIVTVILCAVLFLISFIGTKFAFRVQIFIMILVACALSSIFAGVFRGEVRSLEEITLWGSFADASYWELFAIYFPAVTGIKVGASMSGSLMRPRRSIPIGTIFAWGVSSCIYVALCFWYAFMGSDEALRANFLFSVENAFISELVLLGIMCSCFTAALTSIVAAPRVLQALSSYDILLLSKVFKPLHKGEPRRAFLGTAGLITIILLLFTDINVIAPVITQFFIVIYFIINAVLVVEQRLNLVSFRPEWQLPIMIPIIGSVLSLGAMIIISPILGLLSLLSVAFLYVYLGYKGVRTPWETVQSGMLVAMSEWFMRRALRSGSMNNRRIWKPNVVIPAFVDENLSDEASILSAMLAPQGSVQLLWFVRAGRSRLLQRFPTSLMRMGKAGLVKAATATTAAAKTASQTASQMASTLSARRNSAARGGHHAHPPLAHPVHELPAASERLLKGFEGQGIYATGSLLETRDYLSGLNWVAALSENFFPIPNSIFVSVRDRSTRELNAILSIAQRERKAVSLYVHSEDRSIKREEEVVVWVRDQTPNWHLSLTLSNLDYAVLLGYQIKKNWHARLKLICAVSETSHAEHAREYLRQLSEIARLGERVDIDVFTGNFDDGLRVFSSADLHIIGMGEQVEKRRLMQISRLTQSSCLFVKDSGAGLESALV